MTAKFVSLNGEVHRVLLTEEGGGVWLISYEEPGKPFFCAGEAVLERISAPEGFLKAAQQELTSAQQKRLALIQPLLDAEPQSITDHSLRLTLAKEVAEEQGTTYKRILRLYYRYLAQGGLTTGKKRGSSGKNPDFDWAIKTFYYSAKKFSLRAAYEMMVLQRFTGQDGTLLETTPSWSSFQHYFYKHNYHKNPQKVIARDGLTHYQRNGRPAFGSASQWKPEPGAFQMDATQADICLVSQLDRSMVIGRPNIYLAVDTATQLITGFYVGLEADETAVMKCLECAAMDKVEFCRKFGVSINSEQWPNIGLPSEIITDKGREFFGPRVGELCQRYGVEVETLPPFRPDRKGLVEKAFDLLQDRFKPLLRGRGVIEPDAQERWSVDYRSQAMLNLTEFTAILIHCIIYLNSGRLLSDGQTAAQKWLSSSPRLLKVLTEELHPLTLPRMAAKLTRKGLKINKLWYVPECMNGLFLGDTYQIAYDPSDVTEVFIVVENNYLPCRLTAQSFQAGVSVNEVVQVQKKCGIVKRDAEQKSLQVGVITTKEIQGIVQRAAQQSGIGRESGRSDGAEIQKNRTAERFLISKRGDST